MFEVCGVCSITAEKLLLWGHGFLLAVPPLRSCHRIDQLGVIQPLQMVICWMVYSTWIRERFGLKMHFTIPEPSTTAGWNPLEGSWRYYVITMVIPDVTDLCLGDPPSRFQFSIVLSHCWFNIHIYIYIYIHTHTHTHTPIQNTGCEHGSSMGGDHRGPISQGMRINSAK